MILKTITADNRVQRGYQYTLTEEMGQNFADGFQPHFTPQQMLEYGVFEGCYLNSAQNEYPASWFEKAKLSDHPDPDINLFKIKSRQPLPVWKAKGWIIGPDPRGWFEWYCRYYMGRRIAGVDEKQIKRWRAFKRHAAQVKKNCDPGNIWCRPKQRQGLLQWAYDPFI
ncbi:hypothetical protein [Pseudemcibacter aquimaris]|uniref:hypothetical protein n=1 Tax=Pseudemcibacter aquimaris TaxID=2857064 RepID=UPI00201133CC|nr:hypothetical protein [Pseudemcibacter aquimaris]MCC3860034.1 hypothetical protein [Pseudemcibacter aquimaris]WDU57364.1 hypothetical protein KW060_09150 [Pseudemcibacter aquimaris]